MQFKADFGAHNELIKYGDIKLDFKASDGLDEINKSLTLKFIKE